jgi:hypothetical protein
VFNRVSNCCYYTSQALGRYRLQSPKDSLDSFDHLSEILRLQDGLVDTGLLKYARQALQDAPHRIACIARFSHEIRKPVIDSFKFSEIEGATQTEGKGGKYQMLESFELLPTIQLDIPPFFECSKSLVLRQTIISLLAGRDALKKQKRPSLARDGRMWYDVGALAPASRWGQSLGLPTAARLFR